MSTREPIAATPRVARLDEDEDENARRVASRLNIVSASESAGAATVPSPTATSLATLLSRHVLRDGELVILLLKPSAWFILLSSLRFIAVDVLVLCAIFVFDIDDKLHIQKLPIVEAGVFIAAGRLMWAVLQWASRLYVLTDLRILRVGGVFNVNIFDCPLRKVARTRLLMVTRERLLGLGSIEIIPLDEEQPEGVWQTLARPRQVHEQVVATINKAKQGGCV
jgi:hypothetical protein